MPINLRKVIRALILAGLLLTPVFSYGELLALLQNAFNPSQLYTPAPVKLMKDAIMILIFVAGAIAIVRSGRLHWLVVPFLLVLLYVLPAMLISTQVNLLLTVAGMRWILPLFLVPVLIRFSDEELLHDIATVMAVLLGIHVLAQIGQLFLIAGIYGTNRLGLAGRVPGIFFNPNMAGLFSNLCLFFIHFYRNQQRFRFLPYAATFLSVMMTQSGTALLVYLFFVLFVWLGPGRSRVLLPVAPLVVVLLLFSLPFLTGRADIALSGFERIRILLDFIARGEFFPLHFGWATNAAKGLGTILASGEDLLQMSAVADSMVASTVGNLGIIGLLVVIAGYCLWLICLLRTREADLYGFTLIFTGYAATLTFFEAFPVNLLFAVLLANGLRRIIGPLRRRVETAKQPLPAMV